MTSKYIYTFTDSLMCKNSNKKIAKSTRKLKITTIIISSG